MVLQRWDPFSELRQLQETMNRLWRGFGFSSGGDGETETWSIPIDVYQEGDNFVVCASMPGVNPDNIKVSIEDNVLTIRAHTAPQYEHGDGERNFPMRERRTGSFYRAIRLPDSVDTDKAHPGYEHGVLTIIIPKAESKKAKRLPVNVGSKVLEADEQKREAVGAHS